MLIQNKLDSSIIFFWSSVNTNEWLGEPKNFNKTALVLAYVDINLYEYFHLIYQYETRSRCFTFYIIAIFRTFCIVVINGLKLPPYL